MLYVKLVVVIDGGVGKTCVLLSCTTKDFPKDYVRTVFDIYWRRVTVYNKQCNLGLWYTVAQ